MIFEHFPAIEPNVTNIVYIVFFWVAVAIVQKVQSDGLTEADEITK